MATEPEGMAEEEGGDYEASPEAVELAGALLRAIKADDAEAVCKAFSALADEHAGTEAGEKEHAKPSLAILLGKGH